jgi:hypothetical protein
MKIPKDRQIIINHKMGENAAIWSEADKQFVYANVQVDLYKGEWNMYYFENEYIDEKDIISWREIDSYKLIKDKV